MNCRTAQEKITDCLAASSVFPSQVASHRDSCAKCQAFYETEQGLFESLSTDLRILVNQPVPPSFLPQVRARLDDAPPFPLFGTMQQMLVTIAALVILAVSVGYLEQRPQIKQDLQDQKAAESRSSLSNSAPPLAGPVAQVTASTEHTSKRASSPRSLQVAPEVIISSEERRALVRFVARVPEQNNVLVDLTHSVPLNDDPPPEMASVDVGKVEIQPLEAEARE
jgi:hypothetical protein